MATPMLHATALNPQMSVSITEDFEGARAQPVTALGKLSPTATGLQGTSAFKVKTSRCNYAQQTAMCIKCLTPPPILITCLVKHGQLEDMKPGFVLTCTLT